MDDLQTVFTTIFQRGGFLGSELISGPGSSLASTAKLRAELPSVFRSFGIKRIVDAPCGDMNWMRHLEYNFDFFIGVDIVRDLIERHRPQFPSEKFNFQVGDLCEDILPQADAIFCRDCFGHLPFSKIKEATRLFKLSGATFLLTTTFPEKENCDIAAGGWRQINMQAEPFLWPSPMKLIRENTPDCEDTWTKLKSLGVWSLVSLPD